MAQFVSRRQCGRLNSLRSSFALLLKSAQEVQHNLVSLESARTAGLCFHEVLELEQLLVEVVDRRTVGGGLVRGRGQVGAGRILRVVQRTGQRKAACERQHVTPAQQRH